MAEHCATSQNPAKHQEEYQCPLPNLDLVHLYSELAHQSDCIQMKFHLFPSAEEGQNGVGTKNRRLESFRYCSTYVGH